jgi:hypothetical protein
MTPEPRTPQSSSHPTSQEPEAFHGPAIVVRGVITLVVFALAIVWSTRIWVARSRDLAPRGSTVPRELGEGQIGLVDQVPFSMGDPAAEDRARKIRRLNSHGWVDRKAGIIHIPIERAMELYLQQRSAERSGGRKP